MASAGAAASGAHRVDSAGDGASDSDSATGPPLKIALLTHSVNPRGGVVHTLELAQALHDAGHRVTVLAPALPGQTMFRGVRCRLQLVPLRRVDADPGVAAMVASRIAAFERHLAVLLAREPFDVLHAQDPIGANALAALQERGVIDGFVRTVHHLDPFGDGRLAAWQRRGFERATRVLCVSRLWRDVLRDEHGIDAAVVHNGVDCARFTPQADAGDRSVAERHGVRGDGPVVLAVGGVEQRKNTIQLLDAFASLHAERPGAQLVIAGGASLLDHDAYAADFIARARAAGLAVGAGRPVVLTGTVPDADMPALYRAADVLAMPSLREGFGLAVLEALASGTPVVASRIAPFTEYLNRDGADDCVWADPHDAMSIAAALREALAPARAAALAAGGVPTVCRRFGWPASAARHVALYRAGMAPAGRPPATAAAAAAAMAPPSMTAVPADAVGA